MMRSTWLGNSDGCTIRSVYGNVTMVDSPFLCLLAYSRGAVAIHTVDAYRYEPTAIELFPQRPGRRTL